MLQPNSRDNNNYPHLAGKLSEGLLYGEDASKIFTLETYRYYGLAPGKQDNYNLSMAKSIIKDGSTLTNRPNPSEYKPHLNIQNQRRSFSGMNPSRIPTTSIYDRRPYNSNNSTNGSEN